MYIVLINGQNIHFYRGQEMLKEFKPAGHRITVATITDFQSTVIGVTTAGYSFILAKENIKVEMAGGVPVGNGQVV